MFDAIFQTFSETADPGFGKTRAAALRAQLRKLKLTGFVVPRADEHQSEYVPPSTERLAWLTGFTGSDRACNRARAESRHFRRWPLHLAGARPDRHKGLRTSSNYGNFAAGLAEEQPAQGRRPWLRSMADNPGWPEIL